MGQQCNDNQIGLKTIGELSGLSFFIPNYQRGYRWTRQQVKDLLNDINEFDASKDGFYCLQPLVVRLRNEKDIVTKIHETNKLSEIREILNKSVGKWEVIDGQQRLTTIYIILRSLDSNEPYSLEYATRAKSREFLLNMDKYDENENIDFYYMDQAKKTVKEWLKPDFDKGAFLDKLKNKVNFIWYESVDEDPIKVFTRLNIGKIALTNSELIKALFLNRSNFAGKSTDSLRLRQQEIASEWDKIEYTLQSDEFWLFLHDKGYDRPTRIDFIFDLICSRNSLNIEKLNKEDEKEKIIGSDEHRTFRYFYEYFKSSHIDGNNDEETLLQKTEKAWQTVKSYFQTFNEWYDDLELYHYVGFLLAVGTIPIKQLVNSWKAKKGKKEFVRYLKDEIKKAIGNNSTDYPYKEDGSDKRNCCCLLLFHNIQTVINQNQAQQSNNKYQIGIFYKFPFHLYKLEGWDVEHINSSTSNPEEDDGTRKEWLVNVYLSADEDIRKYINNYFDTEDKNTKDELFKKIKKNFNEGPEVWTPEEKNRIWNYTLLDSSTNRSYGNAIFSAKRRVIIGKDQGKLIPVPKLMKDGKLAIDKESKWATSSFVPPCTKQVFLKYYSSTIGDNNYWTKADAEAYKNDIDSCLEKLEQNDQEDKQ
ncbi:DUF262 domain-containing protein [Bacteroides togonis]|uniref:DUF262 domain-containing protein n=3 Tax=Bacteroidaceae TaxID=815 RepID=UPI00094ADE45|nr:DUF262 domain-containing protein [Bacteroides togonis]